MLRWAGLWGKAMGLLFGGWRKWCNGEQETFPTIANAKVYHICLYTPVRAALTSQG